MADLSRATVSSRAARASRPETSDAQGHAVATIVTEARALDELARCFTSTGLGDAFEQSTRTILAATGRVVVGGMGKSGLIGRKIAATLASTGTPAFFIHPAEASHGDLGMITPNDVMLLLSWSGETSELSDVVTYCRRFGVPVIAITAAPASTLAVQCDHVLVLPDVAEACPHQLAPTSSTAMQLALGDALAVTLTKLRDFSPDDFRVFHPKGQLAAQLVTVSDIMSTGAAIPCVHRTATILQATVEMSRKRFGITAVTDHDDRLIGAFTDGDLRRSVALDHVHACVGDHMTLHPLQVHRNMLASEALAIMNGRNISQLFISQDGRLIGIVHIHDVLRTGVV